MPRTADDVRARLRKRLHDKSLALREEARRVAQERDALQAKYTKETINNIVELKINKAKGEALLSDLDGLVEQIQVDVDEKQIQKHVQWHLLEQRHRQDSGHGVGHESAHHGSHALEWHNHKAVRERPEVGRGRPEEDRYEDNR